MHGTKINQGTIKISTNRVMPVVSSCEESLNEMHVAGRDELCWQMNQAGQERTRKGRPWTTPIDRRSCVQSKNNK